MFIERAIRKSSKKWRRKVKSSTQIQSAERPDIEFKVACDVIESVEFGKIYGFYEITGNFEIDFAAIRWLYLDAAFDFSSSFFLAFSDGFSIKIGSHYLA